MWPFGVALRGEASNHLELRWLQTVVVSVEEKAHGMRQVGIGKASVSTPLLRCREVELTSKPDRSAAADVNPNWLHCDGAVTANARVSAGLCTACGEGSPAEGVLAGGGLGGVLVGRGAIMAGRRQVADPR